MVLFLPLILLLSLQKSTASSSQPTFRATWASIPSDYPTKIPYSPHYDAKTGCMYYADQYAKEALICKYCENCKTICATIPGYEYASAIIPIEGSKTEFLVGVHSSVVIAEWDGKSKTASVTEKIFSNPPCVPNYIDTIRVDPTGRTYFGEYGEQLLGSLPNCSLYSWTRKEGVRAVYTGFKSCFGIAFCSKTDKAFFVDVAGFTIFQFDWCRMTGELTNKKVFYITPVVPGEKAQLLFGLAIDCNGNLYAGSYGGGALHKFNREGCTCTSVQKIELPYDLIGCPEFGGKELDEIFVTAISSKLDFFTGAELQKKKECEENSLETAVRKGGSLIKIKNTGWKGVPSTRARSD